MKRAVVWAMIFSLTSFAVSAFAEEDASEGKRTYLDGFYAYVLGSHIAGVPISYAQYSLSGSTVDSSSPALALGLGYSFSGLADKFLFDFEFEYARGSFSDWRVTDRGLTYLSGKFNFGYVPSPNSAFGIYAVVAGGWILQSEYKTGWEGLDEHLQKTVNSMAIGLAVKFSPFKHFVLRGEWTTWWQSGGGQWRTADYSSHGTFYTPCLGNRIAGGLEFHI